MDSRDAEKHIGQRLGNYELLELLGMGGMGIVFRGRHVILDKPVAIKVIRRQYKEFAGNKDQLLREARAATRVQHPNIVDVTDFGTSPDGEVYFVMEYLEGHSLFHRLQEQGPMPVLGAVNIVRQIVSALSLAHEMGVIHRDLKPENVFLLRRPGRRRVVRRMAEADQTQPRFEVEDEGDFDLVKLLDFGLAKVLMDTSVSATDPNMILGTPAYLAPEQINGPSVDGRTDIYALGILLYEMITGSPPFGGTSVALLRAHVSQQALPPEQMNPDVEIDANTSNTILRCLRKEPRRRFQTMDELDQALAGCFVDRVYLREAANMPGAEDAGVVVPPRPPSEARKPREQTITDELQELFQGSQDGLEQKLEQALDGPPVAPAPPEPEVVVEQVQEQEQEEWKKTKETLPYRSLKR